MIATSFSSLVPLPCKGSSQAKILPLLEILQFFFRPSVPNWIKTKQTKYSNTKQTYKNKHRKKINNFRIKKLEHRTICTIVFLPNICRVSHFVGAIEMIFISDVFACDKQMLTRFLRMNFYDEANSPVTWHCNITKNVFTFVAMFVPLVFLSPPAIILILTFFWWMRSWWIRRVLLGGRNSFCKLSFGVVCFYKRQTF